MSLLEQRLANDLQDIQSGILRLGHGVHKALSNAVNGLLTGDKTFPTGRFLEITPSTVSGRPQFEVSPLHCQTPSFGWPSSVHFVLIAHHHPD